MDAKWWKLHIAEVDKVFQGLKTSTCKIHGIIWLQHLKHFQNSGAAALSLAATMCGARQTIGIGFDCKRGPKGEVHHHGDHPRPLGNAGSMPKWPKQFARLAHYLRDKEVINASRDTALDCFPRANLEDVL